MSTRLPHPLVDGMRIRIYSYAKCLSRYYDVGLACLTYESYTTDDVRALEDVFCEVAIQKVSLASCALRGLRSVWNGLPMQVNFFRFASFAHLVDDMAKRYDVVLCNHIRTTEYVRDRKGKTIIDLVDSYGLRYERTLKTAKGLEWLVARYELGKIRSYEIQSLAYADHALVVSELDREYLITNGAPEDKLTTVSLAMRDDIVPGTAESGGRSISFLGKMSYAPNEDAVVWFAEHVFPRLTARYPDLVFNVIGIAPSTRVLALRSNPRIVVTGFVENPYSMFAASSVVVAPIRFGAGIQSKVLEAMYLARPIVMTTMGAEGIEGRDGEHFLTADDADSFVVRITELLEDRERAERLGAAARALVMERYTMEAIGTQYRKVVERVLGT